MTVTTVTVVLLLLLGAELQLMFLLLLLLHHHDLWRPPCPSERPSETRAGVAARGHLSRAAAECLMEAVRDLLCSHKHLNR